MFRAHPYRNYDKTVLIDDTESDMALNLDADDVDPASVTPENIARVVKALNAEFYG